MKVLHIIVFFYLGFLQTLYAQLIPESRRVDWSIAGLGQPTPVYTHVADITAFGGIGNGSMSNNAALQAAILSLGADSGIIYFPAGTYLFTSPISLRSGLVLRGQDAASSKLLFNLQGSSDLISMYGSRTTNVSPLLLPAYKNDRSIRLINTGLFAEGDYVKLFQNDSALVLDVYNSVGQIMQIKSIAGDTITFYSPLRRSYALSDTPRLRKLSMITGAGVECLAIKRVDSANLAANIIVSYAAHCWVKGVESDSANFAHVSVNNSTNIEITGSYFHGAFGYGPGGQGYGVALNLTSNECLVEDNIFRHLRHSMLLQSGSNGNVFALNYSIQPFKSENQPNDLSGDMVLHGNYPYANLFEGNIGQNIVVDLSHFINGPFNTFFRNRAALYGILFSTGSGDSSNIVGNEITGLQGRYIISGNGHLQYGNNVNGIILPAGTTTLTDSSYYYPGEPSFWPVSVPYPSVGIPHAINTGTIPAKVRYDAGVKLTVCPPDNVLAAHLLALTAEKRSAGILLTWQVNDHHETSLFEAERSSDGINFTVFATVAATELTTLYSLYDYNPSTEITYYRIRQIMQPGLIFYSKIISVNKRKAAVRIYPNPAKDYFIIEGKFIKTLQVVNVSGQPVLQLNNISTQQVIDTKQWAKGIYLVNCVDRNNTVMTEKLVIE